MVAETDLGVRHFTSVKEGSKLVLGSVLDRFISQVIIVTIIITLNHIYGH